MARRLFELGGGILWCLVVVGICCAIVALPGYFAFTVWTAVLSSGFHLAGILVAVVASIVTLALAMMVVGFLVAAAQSLFMDT